MKQRTQITIFFCLMAAIFLMAGCAPSTMSFSPQQAAIQSLALQHGPNTVIDQSSILVRQTVQMEQTAFVAVTYSQTDGRQKMDCMMVFASQQNGFGAWAPIGGGGGCSIDNGQVDAKEPIEFGSGTNGGNGPPDPGFSYANGIVNQADIVKVRVTWEDGQQQEVSVVNSSYLAVRVGEVQAQKVEGLNADGDIVNGSE